MAENLKENVGSQERKESLDFIRAKVAQDCETGKWQGRVVTRFPPEPNGYLHIGHAKSICLNFGVAADFDGTCHLRFDDTNPVKEEDEYVEAIKADIAWLGFEWGDHLYFASDYFDQIYDWAIELIRHGKAFVCDLDSEQMREYRGTLTESGKNSPFRDRTIDENLDLFEQMKQGNFPDASKTLRAKIDMAHANMNMRDPVMYRILHAHHHRSGDKWCIYPMYDFAHGQSDSLEKITHSICTLEFEHHRPLYDWYLDNLGIYHPQQVEFARLNLAHTITSKRKLMQLVEQGHVDGWDDPRMPTLVGMRRRGFTPASIREFCRRIGVAKFDGISDIKLLEHCLRDDLNKKALRRMGVLKPLKVVIDNYPEDQTEEMDAINNPEDESAGKRKVPFSRELYIEHDDFMEEPPKKFFRLAPGREVRLRYAYFITCNEVVKDDQGEIVELRCTYDPQTRGGNTPPDGRKVKATLHWVSAAHAQKTQVHLYDHLFTQENPNEVDEGKDFLDTLNPKSREVLSECWVEPSIADFPAGHVFQLERLGYFSVDPDRTPDDGLILNRTVTLKDSWAKTKKANTPKKGKNAKK